MPEAESFNVAYESTEVYYGLGHLTLHTIDDLIKRNGGVDLERN